MKIALYSVLPYQGQVRATLEVFDGKVVIQQSSRQHDFYFKLSESESNYWPVTLKELLERKEEESTKDSKPWSFMTEEYLEDLLSRQTLRPGSVKEFLEPLLEGHYGMGKGLKIKIQMVNVP